MRVYISTLQGALIAMCVLAAVSFLRLWHLTRDRLFICFAGAFGAFAVNWALLAYDPNGTEHTHYIFAVRLAGFSLIIVGIVAKNHSRRD